MHLQSVTSRALLLCCSLATASCAVRTAPPNHATHSAYRTYERQLFCFSHPDTWVVDPTEPQFNPDHFFALRASPTATVLFVIQIVPLDPKTTSELFINAIRQQLQGDAEIRPFYTWGHHNGSGLSLSGMSRSKQPAVVRVFSFVDGSNTFTLVEEYEQREASTLSRGLSLLQSTFVLTSRPAA